MHQKIDISTIMSKNCCPSKTKKKRLYIGQFELLLYIILTIDNILDRSPGQLFLLREPKGLTPWVDLRCHQYPENGYSVHSNWPLHMWAVSQTVPYFFASVHVN